MGIEQEVCQGLGIKLAVERATRVQGVQITKLKMKIKIQRRPRQMM